MALSPLRATDPLHCGPYRLHGRLGSGGMGVVYLAFGPDNVPVALKVLQPVLAQDEEYRVRFVREVNAARLVESPYVASVVAAETAAEQLWMASEYIEGATLAQAVEANGPVPAERLRGMSGDLAQAIAALHAVGLVHRDLKPANVLLAWSGPKLIDFGIAKHEGMTDLTQAGVTVGSLLWLSPEVINGHPAARSSDIFAWGLCVAFSGTGRPPFGDGNANAVAYRISYEQPDLRGLPDDLGAVVGAALAKDPGARPDAGTLCATLGGVPSPATAVVVPRAEGGWTGPNQATSFGPAAPGFSAGGTGTPPPSKQNQRAWIMALAVIVLLVAAGIAVALLATRSSTSKAVPPGPTASAASVPPTSSPTATPSATTSASSADAAAALDQLLSDSALSRSNVVSAVQSAGSCTDPAGAAVTLTAAATARQTEVQRLQSLDLSALDPTGQLVGSLTNALTASLQADQSFAAWAAAVEGCTGNAPHDSNYAAATSLSMTATAAKQDFVNRWNPIAQMFGLATRQVSDI